jgi:hypothetical protein
MFENGCFRELPSIKHWIMQMRARGAKEKSIMNFVWMVKRVCIGQLPHGDIIQDWGLKHPDRLTLQDCLRYNSELREKGLQGRNYRLAMRNFLKSKNVRGWDEISGKLETQAGKYAYLYISKEKVYAIFEWHAYVILSA